MHTMYSTNGLIKIQDLSTAWLFGEHKLRENAASGLNSPCKSFAPCVINGGEQLQRIQEKVNIEEDALKISLLENKILLPWN